jgi:hypothetical protein
MEFSKTLESWKKIEKAFVKKMLDMYDVEKVEFAPNCEFKDRDVKLTINWIERTYEVKRDYKSQETWNIALEIKCNWKPSGIFASKADYIIYCLSEDEFYWQNRWELLYRIADINKYKTLGWDGERAEMYIIKKELLPLLFNKLEWNQTEQ